MKTEIAGLICGAAFAGIKMLVFSHSPSKQIERIEQEADIVLCKKLAFDVGENWETLASYLMTRCSSLLIKN